MNKRGFFRLLGALPFMAAVPAVAKPATHEGIEKAIRTGWLEPTKDIITVHILGEGSFTPEQIRDSLIPLLNDVCRDPESNRNAREGAGF